MALVHSLGPHAQPGVVSMNLVNVTSNTGAKLVVMILDDQGGRKGVWLTPKEAIAWGKMLVAIGEQTDGTSGLEIARNMPPNMPPRIPPFPGTNPGHN